MKIVKLTAEHFKRLHAVEIAPDPDGHLVIVSGANGQGKSSVLDAIMAALGGLGSIRSTTQPVHDGEDEATVVVELAGPDDQRLTVTRTWKDGKSALLVEDPEGRVRSPQALLDRLVGALSFDPLAFAQKPDREQLADLLAIVDLPFDPEELARRRERLFDRRTDVNREVKSLRARVDAAPPAVPDLPEQEISSAEVLGELDALVAEKASNDQTRADLERERSRLVEARAVARSAEGRVEDLERALEEARAAWATAEEQVVEVGGQVEALQEEVLELEDPDQTPLREKLTTLEQTNAAIRANQARAALRRELTEVEQTAADLSAQIDAIDREKAEGVAAAQMPVDGLSFTPEGITYQGVPFAQASSAEQLRVSVAMAMSLNPELRVIRITDGSLLDSESMGMLEELAAERDFQVWLEVVADEGHGAGVVIEDGRVASR